MTLAKLGEEICLQHQAQRDQVQDVQQPQIEDQQQIEMQSLVAHLKQAPSLTLIGLQKISEFFL